MPQQTYDVIVYGTICLDAIWRVEALPPPGGYVSVLEARQMIGGEAANTAMALHRWGVRVALIGNAFGPDADGDLLRQMFAQDAPELDSQFLFTLPDVETPFCLCIASADGHRTMYGRHFEAMRCAPLTPELARSARFFTMDPNAWDAGIAACQVAAEAGLSILAMDYTRAPEVNRAAEWIVTSTDHVGDLPVEELSAFASSLRDQHDTTVIITRGERGCLVAERGRGETLRIPAYRAPAVVDSTGAGDVFRAGLLYGQAQGWPLLPTVQFASAAAALNCGALGGWGGVRPVEEITHFQTTARHQEDADFSTGFTG